MSGWIKLYRELLDHRLWEMEPFSKAQAWVDILLLTAHQPHEVHVRGIVVKLERGQLACSLAEFAKRWQWSRTKVRMFLGSLEKEQLVKMQKGNVITLVTVLKYDFYQSERQGKEQQNGLQKRRKRNTEKPQKNTYNKGKKEKKDKNVKKGKENILPLATPVGTVDEKTVLNHPESKKKSEKKELLPGQDAIVRLPWDSEYFQQNWDAWKIYRRREHAFRFKSPYSEQQALHLLADKAKGEEQTAILIIRQSMANGWQGLFELKTQNIQDNAAKPGRNSEGYSVERALSAIDRVCSR